MRSRREGRLVMRLLTPMKPAEMVAHREPRMRLREAGVDLYGLFQHRLGRPVVFRRSGHQRTGANEELVGSEIGGAALRQRPRRRQYARQSADDLSNHLVLERENIGEIT